MAIASETGEPTRQPSDCDCHNLFAKLRAQPGEAQPQKCCRHTKCTVAQLLELCKLDPDCIMNLFKLAKGDEKCLPEVEMDQAGTSENDKGKYHFLMVDNSTQGNEENSDKQDDDRLSEVKCMIQQAIGASTATDTDRDRFNNIIWTTSAMGTPNRPSPHQPPTPEETRPTVDQESKTHDKDRSSDNVWYNKSRSPEDSEINDRTTKTVKSYMESMNIVVEDGQQRPPLPVRTPSALDTDSFTREIFTRHNSPVDSEAQGSILKVIELKAGEREEENDALSASKASTAEQEDEEGQSQRDASMMRKKSIIKSRSFTDTERERGKSIIWSDDTEERPSNQEEEEIREPESISGDLTISHLSLIVKEHKKYHSDTSNEVIEDMGKKKGQNRIKKRHEFLRKRRASHEMGRGEIKKGSGRSERGCGLWERFCGCLRFKKRRLTEDPFTPNVSTIMNFTAPESMYHHHAIVF